MKDLFFKLKITNQRSISLMVYALKIQTLWKLLIVFIWKFIMWSCPNFAYVTIAQLQSNKKLQRKEFAWYFSLELINHPWNQFQVTIFFISLLLLILSWFWIGSFIFYEWGSCVIYAQQNKSQPTYVYTDTKTPKPYISGFLRGETICY